MQLFRILYTLTFLGDVATVPQRHPFTHSFAHSFIEDVILVPQSLGSRGVPHSPVPANHSHGHQGGKQERVCMRGRHRETQKQKRDGGEIIKEYEDWGR